MKCPSHTALFNSAEIAAHKQKEFNQVLMPLRADLGHVELREVADELSSNHGMSVLGGVNWVPENVRVWVAAERVHVTPSEVTHE